VCIARTGIFEDSQGRPHSFSEADLERIRAAYDPAKSEAPLVLGHPQDNAPAYGWVKDLKREGAKLFARFAHVPAEVKKLVQNRNYRYVSMSLSPDKTRLLHVGLLGAAAPAIDGLGPVALAAPAVTINFSAQENGMELQELQRQIGELQARLSAAQEEIAKLKTALDDSAKGKDEAEKAKKAAEEAGAKTAAEFAAFRGKLAADTRQGRVKALVDAGKLEPAKAEETVSFAAALAEVKQPVNFAAADGKSEAISAEERYFRELEARPADARFTFSAPAPLPGHAAGQLAEAVPADITKKL
jgi:hypothetical protein